MKNKRKICFVIVNRANYGRVRDLIKFLKKKKNFFNSNSFSLFPSFKKIWWFRQNIDQG